MNKLKSFLKAIWGNIWPAYRDQIKHQRNHLSEIPARIRPETYDECYRPEKPIRGNLAWEQDGIKFVPDKDGKYTKHQIADDVHYVKYIPEFDDDYVMGCDPFNPNNKSRGAYKADVLEHYARYWKEGIGYLPDFLKPQPLSGDVSEQSVILPKMDEIIHRTECEELLLEYDKCKNRHTAMAFYNHLIGK